MAIFAFFLSAWRRAKFVENTVTILVTILSIDAFRTLFESAYLGPYFNSLYGLAPPAVIDVLGQPQWVLVPKGVTLLAGLIILFILIRSWLPASLRNKQVADEELQLAANVFVHSNEGIVILSPEGMTLDANNAFTTFSRFSSKELLGRSINMHRSGEHSDSFYADLLDAVQRNRSWSGQIWNRSKSGLVHPARFDVLTGLPNRSLLADRLSQAKLQSKRRGSSLAVLFIDLDGFKQINHDYGHAIGDTESAFAYISPATSRSF
ncbi:diguanylate cyclase domain-containing protein [Haliea sp.]